MDTPTQRVVHRCLAYLLVLPALLRLLWRARREPSYGFALGQRLGLALPGRPSSPGLWVHAVSAGEMVAAAQLLRAVHGSHPSLPLTLTTTTPAGRARAVQLLEEVPCRVQWMPWDLPGAVVRVLEQVRPRVLVLMEAEWWPGLIDAASARGVRVVCADVRLSAASARRYGYWPGWTAAMLRRVDVALCQSEAVARRLVALGLRPGRVVVAGSMKLDAPAPAPPPRLQPAIDGRWVLVAGSTHAGEEALVLDALAPLWAAAPDLLLILAPRHPRRFAAVRRLLDASGLRWRGVADAGAPAATDQVLLLDSMGDLAAVYGLARLAFVGGSLAGRGGHSLIEPAAVGVAVCSGPSLDHVRSSAERLQVADALAVVADADALARLVTMLRADPDDCAQRGARARAVVEAGAGSRHVTHAVVTGLLAAAPALQAG